MHNFISVNIPEILLVDDTPEHIDIAVSVLQENNFKVRVASMAKTALKLLKQFKPDLILLDIYMPEINGFELCTMIKNDESLKDIPIIFLTASGDEESIKKGFNIGAQDYVIKPFNNSELISRVKTHIRLKQQAESLLEANKELDSFCYSVSHDLKTPILSLTKLVDILLDDFKNCNSEQYELIQNIQNKSEEITNIIEHLLKFSKMCQMDISYQKVDLSQLFLEVYNELTTIEQNRKFILKIDTLPIIIADPILMKLLITNVLSNSIKYTRNKQVAIIEVNFVEDNTQYIISIKDNGAGFDMRYSSRLFGVFQRLHSTNEFEGTGVGLAICKRIINRHKGKVWMTGEVDKGATFYFSIPM